MADPEHNDILLEFNDQKGYFDIELDGPDLAGATSLLTSIIVQLFTDARSNSDDPIPNSRGWAGDSLNPEGIQNIGSRLWVLTEGLANQELLTRIESIAADALRIIVEQGIAKNVTITASFLDKRNGQVLLEIDAQDPMGKGQPLKFVWDQIRTNVKGL